MWARAIDLITEAGIIDVEDLYKAGAKENGRRSLHLAGKKT